MIDELLAELGDDSEDLTDTEVEQAIALPNVERVIEHLKEQRCSKCGLMQLAPEKHAMRRRVPFMYWRIQLRCADHHTTTIIVRMDWLHGSS